MAAGGAGQGRRAPCVFVETCVSRFCRSLLMPKSAICPAPCAGQQQRLPPRVEHRVFLQCTHARLDNEKHACAVLRVEADILDASHT